MTDRNQSQNLACFVIMPISDVEPYDTGHFDRVYDLIIKPACKMAGFKVDRADKEAATNYIVIDIIKKIISADIVLCDLSSNNPNVLYELGFRHGQIKKPVTLIRDSRTRRIFDISGIRDIEYAESLREDKNRIAVKAIAKTLSSTYAQRDDEINSPIQLIENMPAVPILPNMLSEFTGLFRDIAAKLENIKEVPKDISIVDRNGVYIEKYAKVRHPRFGNGITQSFDDRYIIVEFSEHQMFAFQIENAMVKDLECISE